MIEHIWIEDNVDWGNFHRYYKNITVKWKGGVPTEACVTYQGIDTKVRFYTAHQANNHLRYNLWCGIHVQKVLINEVINVDSVLYLVARLWRGVVTEKPITHHKALLVFEVTENGEYIDWGDDNGDRNYKYLETLRTMNDLRYLLHTIM